MLVYQRVFFVISTTNDTETPFLIPGRKFTLNLRVSVLAKPRKMFGMSMGDLQDPKMEVLNVPYVWPYFGGISP